MLKLFSCDVSKMSDSEFLRMYQLCDKVRQNRIDRITKEPAKKLSAAAGMLARIAIGQCLKIDPLSITFRRNKNGKPYAENLDIHFSLSHSGNLAVCAVSDQPVGIDVEKIRSVNYHLADKCFTLEERKYVFSERQKQQKRFFEIWTKKEAHVKRLGTGITDFLSFDVRKDRKVYTLQKEQYVISISTT